MARLEGLLLYTSTVYVAMFGVWQFLLWRFATRWRWLTALHPGWRNGYPGRVAIVVWLSTVAIWAFVNGAVLLLAGPRS
ncbi:MAG TPA: hypothetical protein VIC57_08320 [Candidatus Dormibacteraeota bacterium]